VRTVALVAAAFAGGALFSGVAGGAAAPAPAGKVVAPYPKLSVFTSVLTHVENDYVEDVDQAALIYGAIRGMLATLDPHSSFFDPEEHKDMKAELTGEFHGVGMEIALKDGAIVVIAPIEGFPAAKAGIKAGDRIVEIDGASATGMTVTDAVKRIKGKKGTSVKLKVTREGAPDPLEFSIVRDTIKVVPVEWRMLEPKLGYVRIKTFADKTTRYVREAMEAMEKASGGPLAGLVLDLRDNPGGLLDEAVGVSDEFLSAGLIVSTEGKHKKASEAAYATLKGTRLGFPMVVLVNSGSASASEIVAGALQDHKRALIVGTRTFGKGSVQTLYELPDGSALKLTIARYYTPLHRSIQGEGIAPDVYVPATVGPEPDAKREKDLEKHLKGAAPGTAGPGTAGPATAAPAPAPAPPPAAAPGAAPAGGAKPSDAADYQLRVAVDLLKSWSVFKAMPTPPASLPAK
jgi:carboxyl-terminal processing protease